MPELRDGDLVLTRSGTLFLIKKEEGDDHTWSVSDFPAVKATMIVDITSLRCATVSVFREV